MTTESGGRLIVFVKGDRGSPKSRLAAGIGTEQASAAYRYLVSQLLANLASIQRVELHYTPRESRGEIERWLRPGWMARPQIDGDLGRRMHHALKTALSETSDPPILIGSDCPYIVPEDIQQATRALKDHDLVLGPAEDGGYWLIGLRRADLTLFDGVPWSSDSTLRATVANAAAKSWKVAFLRRLQDIDTAEDWTRYLGSGRGSEYGGG